jgi:hypothetical protein
MDQTTLKDIKRIPAMTPPEVHDYLYHIGTQWTRGVAMELGSWLGATSVPLLHGLVKAGYDKPFWAFDRWVVNKYQADEAAKQGEFLIPGQNSINTYLSNVNAVYDDVRAVKGELPSSLATFVPEEIGILILDAPKKNPVFINCMKQLLPYCIPGVTVIGLLDYYQYRKENGKKREALMAPVDFMHENGAHFMHLKDWNGYCSCSFFVYDNLLTL